MEVLHCEYRFVIIIPPLYQKSLDKQLQCDRWQAKSPELSLSICIQLIIQHPGSYCDVVVRFVEVWQEEQVCQGQFSIVTPSWIANEKRWIPNEMSSRAAICAPRIRRESLS